MPTQPYFVNGKKVPSVTTILSRFKESGGLINWAYNQGKQGLDLYETRDKAAEAGTICHAMMEADIRGSAFGKITPDDFPGATPRVKKNAQHAYNAFVEWKQRVHLKVTNPETALVSEKHLFGGTMDAMLVTDKLILGDWKTSSGIYTDHLIQVAGGYSLLWEENFPDEKLEGIEILRLSKPEEPDDPISFTDHFWGPEVIPMAQRQFLLLREAYTLDKRLKGML